MRKPFGLVGPLPHLVLLALVALIVSACSGAPAQQVARTSTSDLSVGVFGECELPTPLKPILDKLGAALSLHGVEISGEAILVYDHDLKSGGNTLELLLGGGSAWALGAALGLESGKIQGLLDELDATAGLLVTATVGLDFGGNWEGIQFAVDGYVGGDVFGVGGGRWKVLWSTDPTEVGQTGFWASITVASDGACSAGGVVFASDSDTSVLKSVWDNLTGQSSGSDGGAVDSGSAGGGDAGTGYAFVEPRHGARRHAVQVSPGTSRRIAFSWSEAAGAQPPADLWVDVAGRPVLQVSSLGGRPFVRAGLDVAPLDPGASYELVLSRTAEEVRVSVVDSTGQVLAQTKARAGQAVLALPSSGWRASISADGA